MINIVGMVNFLNVVCMNWEGEDDKFFYYVFIDEVYGFLGEEGFFIEDIFYDFCFFYLVFKVSFDYFV